MGEFSPWHLAIVALVFMLLFGAKRLPDAARSIGRSTRILKSELTGLREDDTAAPPPAAATPAVAPTVAPTVSTEKAAPQTATPQTATPQTATG